MGCKKINILFPFVKRICRGFVWMKMECVYRENALCTFVQTVLSERRSDKRLQRFRLHRRRDGGSVRSLACSENILWPQNLEKSVFEDCVRFFLNSYFKKIWLFFDLHCFSAQVLNLCWWLFHTEGAQLWIYSSCVFLRPSTQHANHDQSRESDTVSVDIPVAARFSVLNGVLQSFNARLWARNITTSCFRHPHPANISSGLEMAPNSIFSCVSGGW